MTEPDHPYREKSRPGGRIGRWLHSRIPAYHQLTKEYQLWNRITVLHATHDIQSHCFTRKSVQGQNFKREATPGRMVIDFSDPLCQAIIIKE
jgi:hypothetical protein